jgi:protein arginine N-methyltransferase 1
MYSVPLHGLMMADQVRMGAYEKALRQAVRPGAVVLDIGTGIGIFALLACRFGAGKVYAVEFGDVVHLGKQVAIANGVQDSIEFIQGFSGDLDLPEPADVVVSDLRGVLPLFQRHIPSIIDARERLLKPAGTMIPQQDVINVSVVEAPAWYHSHVAPWEDNRYGFDMSVGREMSVSSWGRARLVPGQLLTAPEVWVVLDYATIASPNVENWVHWVVTREGTAHGFGAWFDSVVGDGATFSNAPDQPEAIYDHAFIPWERPVDLHPGDTVTALLRADLVGDDYVWTWHTRVCDQRGEAKASFRQSTLAAMPLSLSRLRRRAAQHQPRPSEDARVAALALGLMDGQRSLAEIAEHVAERFPRRFATVTDALRQVADLSERYGA